MLIAGIDEAGRGCWAGPVFAAAVILPYTADIPGLNDSKKLSPAQRARLARLIQIQATAWAVASADTGEIDTLNILRASLKAMQRAAESLSPAPQECWVDGMHLPLLACPARAIIGGDALHPAIMAASILAKVTRDEAMRSLEDQYPGYGFARHKGYGTEQHRLALEALGPCRAHRRSFSPVYKALLK